MIDDLSSGNTVFSPPPQTLRRCYSRVKEHGIGKRKSSYTIEQLEKVFGQGGWDSQSCAPVLINSSGLYQEMESDGSTLEEFSQEDWCNQVLDSAFQEGDMDTGECVSKQRTDINKGLIKMICCEQMPLCFFFPEDLQVPKNRALQIKAELMEQSQ